jgi:N-methylhydantoinase A
MLPASEIAGGVRLSGERAAQVFERLAAQLEFDSATDAARGVMRIVSAQMGDAIRSVTIERGRDPRDASLVAFGGAGPLFATLLADELSVRSVIVPAYAGNFSAWGLLRAELTRTISRTYLSALSDAGLRGAGELADALFAQIGDHAANGRAARAVQLDMRFAGQEHTLTVPSPMRDGSVHDDSDALAETFLHEYGRTFGSTIDEALEIVCVRAVLTAGHPNGSAQTAAPTSNGDPRAERTSAHEAWSFTEDRPLRFTIVDRETLPPGSLLPGPAIIREETATTYVDAGYVVNVHDTGALILTRGGRS